MRTVEHRGIYVPDEWLREIAGAHRTTVARWRAAQRLPKAVSLLARVLHHGELELVHDAWRGFRLDQRTGTLWTPENWPCRPGDVLAIQYRTAQVRALERELERAADRHKSTIVTTPRRSLSRPTTYNPTTMSTPNSTS